MAGVGEALCRDRQLVRQLGGGLHEAPEDVHHRAAQRVGLGRLDRLVAVGLDPRDQVRLDPDPVEQADALDALDHEADAAVRHARELQDRAHGPDLAEIPGAGLRVRVALGHQGEKPVAAHHVVDEPDRARLSHHERDRCQREHDRVAQRKDGERVGKSEIVGAGTGRDRHQTPARRFGSVMRRRPRS